MTAKILILPVVRVERDNEGQAIVVRITRRDYARLKNLATAWNVPVDEAAIMVLSRELDPRARK